MTDLDLLSVREGALLGIAKSEDCWGFLPMRAGMMIVRSDAIELLDAGLQVLARIRLRPRERIRGVSVEGEVLILQLKKHRVRISGLIRMFGDK